MLSDPLAAGFGFVVVTTLCLMTVGTALSMLWQTHRAYVFAVRDS